MKLRIDKLTALLVDDATVVRKRLIQQFTSFDFPVDIVEAVDGADALTKTENLNPESTFIVLDINMPNMNGIEFLTQLRLKPGWSKTPCVLNSATTKATEIESVNKLNVLDMAPKPINTRRLTQALVSTYCEAENKDQQALAVEDRLKILIVDDEEFDRDYAARLLKQAFKERLVLDFADSGATAEQKVREQDFDCIIFDYYLGDTDGATAIRELRENGVTCAMVVLTGSGDEFLAAEALKSGASDYRTKDGLSAGGLKWTIEHALEHARLKREDDLRKVRSIRQARASALGTMAGGIAHEINNPLAILQSQGFVLKQMADSGRVDAQLLEKVSEMINSSVSRVAKIIKGLVQYSASGRVDKPRNIQIQQLIEDTMAYYEQRFLDEKISLHIDNSEMNNKVFVNVQDFTQSLMNVIDNAMWAVRHSESDSRQIKISAHVNESNTEILVFDSGPGIDEDTEDKMMEPFFTTKPVNRGSGLGLSVAQSLLREMQGEVVYDRSQKQTCFKLVVPNEQVTASKNAA